MAWECQRAAGWTRAAPWCGPVRSMHSMLPQRQRRTTCFVQCPHAKVMSDLGPDAPLEQFGVMRTRPAR
jgi:hypothetical protein